MSELTLDTAIKHCLDVAERQEYLSQNYHEYVEEKWNVKKRNKCADCAAEHRQLAEWLIELKKANSIIRVCNRMLGYLLECEIESTSTRHEVETLLKNITEYLSGGSENG